MDFLVHVYREKVFRVEATVGAAVIIPFDAEVESRLFTGRTLPGAADVQMTNAAGIRHMCASYMFEGKDFTGAPCKLFVRNDGFFEPGSRPKPFHACPTFLTDSETLAPFLHTACFRAEGIQENDGLHIRIYHVSVEEIQRRKASTGENPLWH